MRQSVRNTLHRYRENGFSLVELSVVLVILALLIGGAAAGRSLLQASQLRAIYTDEQRYAAAVNDFYKKYDFLPGDFPHATDIWGTASNCPDGGSTTAATCNGDGDGKIMNLQDGNSVHEGFSAWQHLANAGMIQGSYTGAGYGGGSNNNYNSVPKINVPAGAMESSGYSIFYADKSYTAYPLFPDSFSRNVIIFGGGGYYKGGVGNGGVTDIAVISAAQAWAIDRKFDDGLPGTGRLTTYVNWYLGNCNTSNDPTTSTYKTTNTIAQACNLIFIPGF